MTFHQLTKNADSFLSYRGFDYRKAFEKTTQYYLMESITFLYANRFLRKNKTMKFTGRVTAVTEDLVARDYKITIFNMLKTFFLFDTGLLRYSRNATGSRSLVAAAIAKSRDNDLFFTYPNMLYHTICDYFFKTVRLKVNTKHKQYGLPAFIKQVRPLNKLLFFTLFTHHKKFSFNLPIFVSYKLFKNSKLKLWYLGFKFTFYQRYAVILRSFYKKNIILHPRKYFQLRKFNYKKPIISRKNRRFRFISKSNKLTFRKKKLQSLPAITKHRVRLIRLTQLQKILKPKKRRFRKSKWHIFTRLSARHLLGKMRKKRSKTKFFVLKVLIKFMRKITKRKSKPFKKVRTFLN